MKLFICTKLKQPLLAHVELGNHYLLSEYAADAPQGAKKFLEYRTWHPPDIYNVAYISIIYVTFIVYNKMPFCWTLNSYTGKWIIHPKHAFIWPSAFLYCYCIWKYLHWGSEQVTELRLHFYKVLPRTERDESGRWMLIFITEDLNSLGMHESIVICAIYLQKLDSRER